MRKEIKVTVCDRCGTTSERAKGWITVQLNTYRNRHTTKADMCPTCTEGLKAFLSPKLEFSVPEKINA